MKILDKYIIKSYFLRLIGVFAICFVIFIIQTFWLYVDELAGKGLDIFTIGKFFIYFSPKLVPLVLPLSILLASLMTYGTLSENSEFIAMKSNGISIIRTMLGLLIFHVFLGIGTFYFSNYIVTYGELKSFNLRKNLAKLKPTLAIREGMFNNIGDMNIKVNRKYGDNEQYLEDIILHKINFHDEINRIVIKAESGEITSNNGNYLQLILKNGNRYEEVIAEDDFIVCVARFAKNKRHDLLIKAYASSNIEQKLLLFGTTDKPSDEENLKNLKNMIHALNLEDKVIFKGFVENPYPWIKKAKALILSSNHEALSSVLIESLILNTQVVSTNCPTGPSEILEGDLSQFLSPVDDAVKLASNIKKAIDCPIEITNKYYDKFNGKEIAKQYLSLAK